ncbi:ras-related protein RabG2-like isoform X5 [Ruditapes philippinarum]|uniref:ras-related protein RabG2-like isoform X5 n=1 Tax=Ruditapes philippinarum TaxID=129788 RepID=UPI00295BDC8A|nr:ras-related protein RabG2-like isoform X5 [Ruditapes philippinarum]
MLSAFRIKVVVVGDYGVSKTSMLKSVVTTSSRTDVNVQYGQYSDTEIELHVRSSLRREPVTMMIWDTCSQEKFRSLTASYYRGAHGCLVLFDVTKESTFNNLTYWLHDLKEYSTHPEISTVIVGTKCHVTPEEREVSHERAVKFAESVGLPYMEVSAEENKNVTEVFEKLADSILENLTKDSTPNMQQPNRVILSKQQKPKKQWCSC